ncbi:MmpS family protein [Actinoallomurus sp. NBC_01490]|uniref:MmpS family transport accessory protein n=1 Tax=Actinoallomurus sp. NBC_01490 TaxID=2903557 RepID=UPI002E34D540|nr:MmpS family transport accessory protein [Actinoallomurus sp. NBC_01490]
MRTFIAVGIAAGLLALAGCTPVADSADPNIAATSSTRGGGSTAKAKGKPKPKTTRTLTYRIGGSATRASITYSTPSGQEQQNGARVPWKKSFKIKKDTFDVLTVTAQNSGSGTITCEIDVDGVKVKAAKSSGAYAIASCDHTLGF